jgi:MFS family permease
LPLTGGFIIAASISSQLFARIGTKPVVVLGTVIAAGGLYWLSRVSVDGSYLPDILPGLLTVSIGMGGVFTGLTTAANAGVDQDKAGLAAGLLNTGQQLGAALGLAILSAIATAHTTSLLQAGHGLAQASTEGYQRALLVGAGIVLAATVVAFLTPNSRQTTPVVEEEPALDLAA